MYAYNFIPFKSSTRNQYSILEHVDEEIAGAVELARNQFIHAFRLIITHAH